GLIEIGNPSVVTVEPAGVAAAFIPHPGIRTGDSLHNRCARLAMSFVAPEGTLDVFTFYVIKTAGKNSGVLNRCGGSLRHVRRHRMGGITEENYPSVAPAPQRVAFKDRPFVTIRARLKHIAGILMEAFIGRPQFFHVAFCRPGFARQPFSRLGYARDKVNFALGLRGVVNNDVAIGTPPFRARASNIEPSHQLGRKYGTIRDASLVDR